AGHQAVGNLQEPAKKQRTAPAACQRRLLLRPGAVHGGRAVYNFAWPDFTTVQFERLLDVVKVMQFAASEGSVAVHCHAGLGRTGLRLSGEEAIAYVRHRRPQSIQTQLQGLRHGLRRTHPAVLVLFPHRAIAWGHRFSYEEHMRRQAAILHGEEAKRLRYLSQLVYAVTQRLLQATAGGGQREELLNQVLSASPALDEELEGWGFTEQSALLPGAKLTAFLCCAGCTSLRRPRSPSKNVSTLMKTQTITGGLDAWTRYTSTLVRYMALFLLQLVSDQSDDAEAERLRRYFIKLVDYVEGLLERRVSPELVWRDRATGCTSG
uniref:TYR_PHOSPHATASE_2 domain-containing protein n=1 Tax=Macrostomum lignano TaxID=282301 RepID=A0A1I8FBD9_9PLAT